MISLFLAVPVSMMLLFFAPPLDAGEDDLRGVASQAADLQWDFPTSSGRPVKRPGPEKVERAMQQRQGFAVAARRLVAAGDPDRAMKIAAETWRLWVMARDEATGRAFLKEILDSSMAAKPSRHRALALYGDGLLAFRLGNLDEAGERWSRSLGEARMVGDIEGQVLGHLGMSRVELSAGNATGSFEYAQTARNLGGDLPPAFGQAPLHMVAQARRLAERWKEAARLFRESLELNRRLGDTGMVVVELHNLGHVELRLGHVDVAERLFTELTELEGPPQDPYGAALSLFNQAALAHGRRDSLRALELLKQARQGLASAGMSLASDDALDFERLEREAATGRP